MLKRALGFTSNILFFAILFSIFGIFVYKYASTFSTTEIGTGKIHCDLNQSLRTCRFTPIDISPSSGGIRTSISYNIDYNDLDDDNKKYIGSNCSNVNRSSDGLCTFTVFGNADTKKHEITSAKIKMPE
ncbi:hypothetical protein NO263_16915 [Gluconacetobacter entanii]|uniref:Secreted protein n=1 Tax=Gluconacetobacter entanii TaxID=108528 RepID=A0ABT3KA81_9PROT|nr:hypothetical protein [Gluconacetobacter entanii]MBE7618494.1 hypothetical protein [Komagataeibacter sp. FXV2]MCW4592269.1 hypothetical protein [Gluconacetobacter entanii]MCW4595722.1 hypothetical protein [Gluconacetobacter entanii]NPC87483.1 hypothetical protein [Gluconacetobacter entanii]